ncbi:hypothetical protein QBC47DRAFT_371598 [Echria macrotheca]|uniref:NECAP PHear domain-containing protein n=1 Tax=Echria macrotheca TaxID=438768 RepID=A0AAJ0BJY7_9PEZI|nr:hypothetical protein QBC47DRAFT_371598 [Echria macrotheca]
MTTIDPSTNQPLPPDAIQRVLHITQTVHVYSIPPLSSARGHLAATWTEDPKRHIFTCRLRVLETSIPTSSSSSSSSPTDDPENTTIKIDIILEDPSSGQLFAAAPYTAPAVVDPAADSSRFFALRVQDPTGRKATLGIGFEERSEAFDFGVALQEAQRSLSASGAGPSSKEKEKSAKKEEGKGGAELKDYSLKDGETITVNLSGTRFGRGKTTSSQQRTEKGEEEPKSLSSFALPPPPGTSTTSTLQSSSGAKSPGILPPPPSAHEVRRQKRLSAQELGFDDGQFGEFA